MRRCLYCGFPLDGGNRNVCSKHADLPGLDPDWKEFLADMSPSSNRCMHCDGRVRESHINPGEPVECPTCWWLVRHTRDEILEFAAAIETALASPGR